MKEFIEKHVCEIVTCCAMVQLGGVVGGVILGSYVGLLVYVIGFAGMMSLLNFAD